MILRCCEGSLRANGYVRFDFGHGFLTFFENRIFVTPTVDYVRAILYCT